MRRPTLSRRAVLTAVTLTLPLAGCSTSLDQETTPSLSFDSADALWPQVGHDRQFTSSTAVSLPAGPLQAERILKVGRDDRDDGPTVVDGQLAVATEGTDATTARTVFRDIQTETELWSIDGLVDYTTPSVYGDVVILSGNGHTTAIRRDTGTILWEFDGGASGTYMSQLLHGETLAVASDGRVVALDAQSGSQRWMSPKLRTPYAISGDSDSIFVSSQYKTEHSLSALDWESGEQKWFRPDVSSVSVPVVSDEFVYYVDSVAGVLEALAPTDGSPVWSRTVRGISTPPALTPSGSSLVVSSETSGQTTVRNAATGAVEWSANAVAQFQPVVTKSSLFIPGYDTLYRISREEKRVVDQVSFAGPITSPVMLTPDGCCVTAGTEQNQYAVYHLTASGTV
ncbi:PQQ-binding-like beta-propeller repeat protein (plasmid) [Haloferax sp. S1W]|uniref:PQQ-binding-like beta-propeller repeat protein n=1 Tax=Haloferax sp. S1W TaxID=3377110 RepID=UPI0037C8CA3B